METLHDKVREALNGARSAAGLPALLLDSSCSRLLNAHCERMLSAAGSGQDVSRASLETLASMSRAGILDVRHLIAASGVVASTAAGEGGESKEADGDGAGATAAGVLFDTLASQEALQAMVTSPAASEPLTHVAVGFASEGGHRSAVCVALLDRRAAVVGVSDTGAQMLRVGGSSASSSAAIAVYRDELAEAGAGVVTLQLRPDADLEAVAAPRPALGARLALLKGGASASAALAVAGDPQPLPAVPATVQDEETHVSLEQVAACWQRIRVALLEDSSAAGEEGAAAGDAASGFAEAFDANGTAFVWPWQVNCRGDEASADVEVPLAVPLLEAAASSGSAGAGGGSADEPLATVLVQLVGDASGGSGASAMDEPDASFPVARLRPRRPLGAGTDGDAAAAGSASAESVSSAVIAVHIFASRPSSHPPRGAADAAVSLDDAPSGASIAAAGGASGGASAVRSRRSSSAAAAAGASAAGSPLPAGFTAPTERPAVSPEAHAAAPLHTVALANVADGGSSSSSAAATLKPQHMGVHAGRAPLTTVLPQSLLLGFLDAAAGGDAAAAPVSRLMLVSGSSEADALASAPEGFELLPGDLADAVKLSLAGSGAAAAGGGGGAGAGASGADSSVVTVHPAAVFIAVQRVGAPGSLGDASPLVDAGLLVVAGVTAASAAGADAGSASGGDGSSDAAGAGSGLLLPSVSAPSGYSLQMKDIVLSRDADAAAAASAAGDAAGEGKEGEGKEDAGAEGSSAGGGGAAASVRVGLRIVLLTTADAGAVEAATAASAAAAGAGSGAAPLAIPVVDHPAAAAALGASASASASAAAAGTAASSSGGAGAGGRPPMQFEADGVVGSAGEDATSGVPPPPPPAPLVAGSRTASRPTSGGGAPKAPGHLALKLLGEKPAAGAGAGAGDDEDELAALGGAGGAARAGGKPAGASGAGAGAGKGAGGPHGGAREDKHRQQLVELLAAALGQQQQLAAANARLHRQLTTYFSLRQGEGEGGAAGGPGSAAAAAAVVAAATGGGGGPGSKSAAAAAFAAADKERRYREQLDGAASDRERLAAVTAQGERDATELQLRVEEREGKAEQLSAAFADFKHQIAGAAVNSHTGRRIPSDELERAEALEREKDGDVAKVQLRHVHLAAQVAKLELSLRKREQVADGLAMMDFEQLKIENATLTEKIEDRNEELAKLKKKAAVAVQVLTHVREKLHFVQAEAGRLGSELAALEAEVSEQRALLALAKKERELARAEADRAAHAQGFAHADRLAIDFERRKRDIVACRDALDATQARLARLQDVAAERTALLAAATAGSMGGGIGRAGLTGGIGGSSTASFGSASAGASAGSRAFGASSATTHGSAAGGGAGSGTSRRPPVPVPTGHATATTVRTAGAGSASVSGGLRAAVSAGVSSGGSLKR